MAADGGNGGRDAVRRLVVLEGVWVILFAMPLAGLARFAWGSDLQSHILLIPFISGWLAARQRHLLSAEGPGYAPAWGWGFVATAGAAAALFYSQSAACAAPTADVNDILSPLILSFVSGVVGICALAAGRRGLRAMWFPLLLLVFMVPLPTPAVHAVSVLLQEWSADAASAMLGLTGIPLYREGLVFRFPGLVVEVAEECSGIHSSLVLLITGLLAGHLFLGTAWRRIVLVLAVLPIGVLRNGLRVTVISTLTETVDRGIIDGPLHHHGGPIFFVLSLLMLFGVLFALRRGERCPGTGGRGAAPAGDAGSGDS